jgi:hypothetical protein
MMSSRPSLSNTGTGTNCRCPSTTRWDWVRVCALGRGSWIVDGERKGKEECSQLPHQFSPSDSHLIIPRPRIYITIMLVAASQRLLVLVVVALLSYVLVADVVVTAEEVVLLPSSTAPLRLRKQQQPLPMMSPNKQVVTSTTNVLVAAVASKSPLPLPVVDHNDRTNDDGADSSSNSINQHLRTSPSRQDDVGVVSRMLQDATGGADNKQGEDGSASFLPDGFSLWLFILIIIIGVCCLSGIMCLCCCLDTLCCCL